MPAKMPQHVREEQLNALPNIRFVEWDTSARRRAIMICEIDGHVWSSKVDNLIYGKRGCPKCGYVMRASKRRTPKDLVESKLRELSSMSFIGWVSGYSNNKSKLTMRCDVCQHTWDTTATQMLSFRSGCAKCAGNFPHNQTERESSLNRKSNARFVRWEESYVNAHSKAVMQCDAGH